MALRNPILAGFDPAASFRRVGKDRDIAISAFERYPGGQSHSSRILARWRRVARPLDRLFRVEEGAPGPTRREARFTRFADLPA